MPTPVYVLEWSFTPTDYFEEPVTFDCEGGSIRVENGAAEARISEDAYPEDQSRRNALHEDLNARFLAAQVLSHKPYSLTQSKVARVHPDGRRDVWVFPDGATIVVQSGSVDLITKDASGKVVRDTKRERIDSRNELAQLAARHIGDPVANAILRSYSAAVADAKNELIHLYEIRDALGSVFDGEKQATAAVGISGAQWSRLGQLANSEPILQGRHRGSKPGSLRGARLAELTEAREIARAMIIGYLRSLG